MPYFLARSLCCCAGSDRLLHLSSSQWFKRSTSCRPNQVSLYSKVVYPDRSRSSQSTVNISSLCSCHSISTRNCQPRFNTRIICDTSFIIYSFTVELDTGFLFLTDETPGFVTHTSLCVSHQVLLLLHNRL